MKANVGHRLKSHLIHLKIFFLYNLWCLAALKTLDTLGEVILELSFLDTIIFLEALLFKFYSISLFPIKKSPKFLIKINYTIFKTIECPSVSLVTHKEGGLSLFRMLFGLFSGTFQFVLVCSRSSCSLEVTEPQNALTCNFSLSQLNVDLEKRYQKNE